MELVGHSTAAAKTTADCVRFDRLVTATAGRGPPVRQPAPPKDA